MGLRERWRASRIKTPVPGTFTVAALVMRARTPGFYRIYDVDGVIAAPGVEPTPARKKGVMVRDAQPLMEGQVFAATIDRSDPRRSIVAFPPTDAAKPASSAEREDAARRLAEQMRAQDSGDA